MFVAVIVGLGALVGALEVTAHAVGQNNVLRPSSGLLPATVFSKPQSATGTTTATTKPGKHSAIGSSVVVIIGQSSKTTQRTTPPTTAPSP